MPETFDMSGLTDRINKIKENGREVTEFNLEFLRCLMTRHCLKDAIPLEFIIDNVPPLVIEKLQDGELPTIEEMLIMSPDTQNTLLFELIWVCGLNAIYINTNDEESELQDNDPPDYFQSIVSMLDVSPAHYMGSYLAAVYTLLMGKVPTVEFIEIITNNFNCSDEQLNKNKFMISELALGLFLRWKEDQFCYNQLGAN